MQTPVSSCSRKRWRRKWIALDSFCLTPEQQEDVLQLVVRLNGGRGNMSLSEAASKDLKELDLGEWELDVADAATFLKKRDYAADSAQLQIIEPVKPDCVRNFWLCKAAKQFPLLSVAANQLVIPTIGPPET